MLKKISVLLFAVIITIQFSNTKVLAASTDIIGPSVIHKEENQIFTIGQLLQLYEADVFIGTDGYTGYGNIPGEYTVTLTQGFNTKDVTIYVVEDWGNLERSTDVLYVVDYKEIYVSNDRMLTLYEIIYYIFNTTGFVVTDYQFMYEELIDEYHSSFENGVIPEGSYEFTFRLTYFSGLQDSYLTYIHTVEIQEISGILLEPPPTTMDKFISAVPWLLAVGVIGYLANLKFSKKKRGFNL